MVSNPLALLPSSRTLQWQPRPIRLLHALSDTARIRISGKEGEREVSNFETEEPEKNPGSKFTRSSFLHVRPLFTRSSLIPGVSDAPNNTQASAAEIAITNQGL